MSYLSKSLAVDQEIVVHLTADADREEVARRLMSDGVRLKVLAGMKHKTIKLGVIAPAGLTPSKRESLSPTPEAKCLSLSRAIGSEVVVTLRDGASAGAVLDWLAADGLVFQVVGVKPYQASTAKSMTICASLANSAAGIELLD